MSVWFDAESCACVCLSLGRKEEALGSGCSDRRSLPLHVSDLLIWAAAAVSLYVCRAIEASPIHMGEKEVFVEEKRTSIRVVNGVVSSNTC